MPKRITKLTADQESRFAQYVQMYTKIGLSCEEADWEKFEAGVRRCYHYAGLEPPKVFVRVQSPIVLAFAASIAAYVISSLRQKDKNSKKAVDSAVGSAVHSAVRSNWHNYIGGQFWVSWQGFLAFLRDVCDLQFNSDIWDREKAYADAQASACWWRPHKDFVMVCNRPEFIKRDEQGRLHSDRSMSIRFRDGWGLYHWHGVEVSAQIILKPYELTATQALGEQNAEVRRVIIERIGMERFLSEAGAISIHKHDMGELFFIDLPGDPDQVLRSVRVKDPSTGRFYFLRVPPSIDRAEDAVAWTFGFDTAKQYRPITET